MSDVMHRVRLTQRRILATLALLLVSFFGVFGWSTLRLCDQSSTTRLSAMPLKVALHQCKQCLSGMDLASLLLRESPAAKDENAMLHNASIDQSLAELQLPPAGRHGGAPQETVPRLNPASLAWSGPGSPQQAKPIAWPIPASVLFLYDAPFGASSSTQSAPRRIGTGFVLVAPEPHIGVARYLVTARHVVDPQWAHCAVKNPQSITVRFNRIDGGAGYETISLDGHRGPIFRTSQDDLADLALIPINEATVRHLKDYRLAETAFNALPSESELGTLHKEQQIVTVGVSSPELAGLRDSPVSAPGVMATDVSGAEMAVRCTAQSPLKSIHMWLINASVELGISGAPVYAAMARGQDRVTTPVLVGVQTVVWPDRGQAGVTPVAALRALVQQQQARGEVALNSRRAHPD